MTDFAHQRLLLDRASSGDAAALEELLLMHCDAVMDHIRPKLAGPLQTLVSVEDILQETFFKAFQQIDRFEAKSDYSFLAWLKTIAESRIVDAIKHQKRKKRGGDLRRVEAVHGMNHTTVADLMAVLAEDEYGSPSQIAANDEACRAMQIAIASLPKDQRQAVILRYFRQQSLEEIGKAMDRSAESVRGLLRRAKVVLRQQMQRTSCWFSKR